MLKGYEVVRETRGRDEHEVLLPWLISLFEILIACVRADVQLDWVPMQVLHNLGGELFDLVGDEPREDGENGDVHVVSAMCLAGLVVSYDFGHIGEAVGGSFGPSPPPTTPPPLCRPPRARALRFAREQCNLPRRAHSNYRRRRDA